MKRISGTILIAFAALALMTLPLSAQTSVPAAGTAQPAAADQQKTETQPAQTDAAPVQSESIPQARPLKPSPMQVGEPETEESLLVSAEWLKKNRGQVVLVDARPESLYAGGHIPGAVNASWTYFANMNAQTGTKKWGTIWQPATMAKRIGALGINGKKPVVVYDDAGGWGQNGWTLWILRMSGIRTRRYSRGSFTAWKKAGEGFQDRP